MDAAVDTAIRFRDAWEDSVKSLPVNEPLKRSIEIRWRAALPSGLPCNDLAQQSHERQVSIGNKIECGFVLKRKDAIAHFQ